MLNLSNPHHKLVIESDGQKFEVRALCHRMDTANMLCADGPTLSVIDIDGTSEMIIVADEMSMADRAELLQETQKNNLTLSLNCASL